MWEYSVNQKVGRLNVADLAVDQAIVNITSYLPHKIWMYTLSEECIKCPFSKFLEIGANKNIVAKFSTSRPVAWQFVTKDLGPYALSNESSFCTILPEIGQFGVYNVDFDNGQCNFSVGKEPVGIYLSILYVILILILVSALLILTNKFYKKYVTSRLRTSVTNVDTELDKPKPLKPRLRSLDTFRGIAIVLMIFVNSGGGHYWWMEHAVWNGLHVADLVFPWFLWIMGVCIPMSIKSQVNRNTTKKTMFVYILSRSLKLFFIGLCLNTAKGPNFGDIRIMGVLQRFGIAYLIVTTLHIFLSKPITILPQEKIKRSFYDIYLLASQWCIMLAIICVHLIITFTLLVPGCATGYLGPGGKHDMLAHKYCIGGATGYIDRIILGEKHIYQHPTAKYTYDSQPFDPEGIFGCLLTLVQVFFGVQCGMILIVYPEWKARIRRWLIWALVTGLLGGILCLFSQEDGFIPVNKNMWSLSFVLVTTSFAFILLSFCYFVIDIRNVWSGSPLVYAGMNAIIMYVGHSVFHSMLPWHWRIGPMNTHFMLLLECTWNTSLWVLISYYLFCKKIFLSI